MLGGARRGMLLNNLSVSDGCKVSFDSSEPAKTAPPSPEAPEAALAGRVFKRPGEAGGGEEAKVSTYGYVHVVDYHLFFCCFTGRKEYL